MILERLGIMLGLIIIGIVLTSVIIGIIDIWIKYPWTALASAIITILYCLWLLAKYIQES